MEQSLTEKGGSCNRAHIAGKVGCPGGAKRMLYLL